MTFHIYKLRHIFTRRKSQLWLHIHCVTPALSSPRLKVFWEQQQMLIWAVDGLVVLLTLVLGSLSVSPHCM